MTNVRGSQAHAYRTIPTKNADPTRRKLNRVLVGTVGDIVGDVQRRTDAIGCKVRSNSIPALELMLTTSPQHWEGKNGKDLRAWVDANLAWARKTYGAANVVHAVLHLDEMTPHISMFVVPEIEGRLSARDVVGGHGKMIAWNSAYAEAMQPFGLQRGLQGSGATREKIDKFYTRVNMAADAWKKDLAALGEPMDPPAPSIFQSQEGRKKAVEGWKGDERGKRKALVQKAAQSALAATLANEQIESLKHANNGFAKANEDLVHELAESRNKLSAAYQELGLSKDQVGALRKTDISLVAQHLGFFGEVLPKENPIDLVKRVNGFNYEQAVAWLHHEIGSLKTGAVVSSALSDAPPKRPFTPAENTIKQSVLKQCQALGCDSFRITLLDESGPKTKAFLPGKAKREGEGERFYSTDELVQMIPFLRFKNNTGWDVHLTPMDEHAFYVLLDDARPSVEQLEAWGFEPCLAQNSSWDKQQVVFKVPKSIDRQAVLAVFNELNKKMGDPEMTSLRHSFRMAGFRNLKPKHEREGKHPFVKITMAINRFCKRCTAMCKQVEASRIPSFHLRRYRPDSTPFRRAFPAIRNGFGGWSERSVWAGVWGTFAGSLAVFMDLTFTPSGSMR